MRASLPVLGNVRVATPCAEPWEKMQPVEGASPDRVRQCARCELPVFDLSALSESEAVSFVAERLGAERTCVQFYRRADGTLLTRDCPVGWRRVQRRVALAAAAVVSFLALGAVTAFAGSRTLTCHTSGGSGVDPLKSPLVQRLIAMFGAQPPPARPQMLRGEMVYIAPPSTPATAAPPVAIP